MHRTWLDSPEEKSFDLWLSYYGDNPGRFCEDADYYEVEKGLKWPVLASLLARRWEHVRRFDRVCLPDCDIQMSSASWARFFALFEQLDLWIAQPALEHGSDYSHGILLQDPNYVARFTSFVEIMAPCFSIKALEVCRRTFGESQSGWGLDWIWKALISDRSNKRVGVIDAVTMLHSNPVERRDMAPALRTLGVNPTREMIDLLKRYGVVRQDRVFGGVPRE